MAYKPYYKRHLPHIQFPGATLTVTVCTKNRIPWFTNDQLCLIVESAMMFLHGHKYDLFAYVVMPDHAHMLIRPLSKNKPETHIWRYSGHVYSISEITQALKGYTAHRINKLLNRQGRFWQGETYDRYLRSDEDFWEKVRYIHENPVRSGLVTRAEDYRWSSLNTIYSGRKEFRDWFA